jgi:hypothetical protein
MRRLKFPKIRKTRINYLNILTYLTIILLTSVILVAVLISLPLTERISTHVTYDLHTKNDLYWAREYTLDLDTTTQENRDSEIDGVKSVLFKRLSKLGVEKVTMSSYQVEDSDLLVVSVQSSLPQQHIDELVRNPFLLRVVTRDPDVDFEDEENFFAIYLEENYIETGFTREDFRNIHITKLRNAANEYSYFALFKTWPWDREWKEFLLDHAGEEIGVAIDAFVTPTQISPTDPTMFALPVSTLEKQEAELISILYNSGVVPVSYFVSDQQEIPIEVIEADYIRLIEGILLAIVIIYIYLLFIDRTPKQTLIISGLSTVITLSIWITYLKIANIPVDIFLLALQVIIMVGVLRITSENNESRVIINVLIALIASLAVIFGTGFVRIFAADLFVLIVLGHLAQFIATYYVNNVRKVFTI